MGPIYLESTSPEVFKTSFGKIQKIHPSETTAKNPFVEVKSTFVTINQKFLRNNIYSQGAICIIYFQYQPNPSTLIFHELILVKNQSAQIGLLLKI